MRTYLKSLMPAVWLYPGLSLAATAFAFSAVRAGVWAMFACLRSALGTEKVYWIQHLVNDSAESALLSAGLALAQYFLASFLVLALKDKALSFSILFFSASVSGALFSMLAAGSNLGASRLCALPVIAACLLGGFTALFQKESENPMNGLEFNPFIYPKKFN